MAIKNIFIWFVELAMECVLGAYIALLVFGSNGKGVGVLENVRENIAPVLFFVLLSGYFATRAWFEVLRPRDGALAQTCTNGLLFCVHACGFLILIGTAVGRVVDVLVLGLGAVIFASLIGSGMRKMGSKQRYG